jgi:hypothetical protein
MAVVQENVLVLLGIDESFVESNCFPNGQVKVHVPVIE